ncbi:MAG: thiol-disulfide oxidoreductase DCC family protein [Lutibacter sp.]|uniref:thiol-disulfide oxidoreductase DCC family protein n=1 Tax=Lutibacter sp. TaxID=1925666 RepID=UPI001833A42C|nr:thiol-disulfide oxidoreductase DCC family protein [Lutibacter sp.]MBT8317773.1 thiol-disulfide oxidoreductase DCC family protein [Lutibacter sp.]NNJ58631.1 thiol-disulfide oxidoreductase DCC family protein [Lutibacter sp.]
MNNFKGKSIILFDGICNLCNSSVNFIIRNDKKEHFLFASLQSDAAKEILLQYQVKKITFDSILLIENGKIYTKSTAALRISRNLDGTYRFIYFLKIIPKSITDWIYDIIANNRYKWFGKKESCMMPDEKLKSKFLS